MVDFDGDGNVITPSGILNELAGGDQARVDRIVAANKAAAEPVTVPWESDTTRADYTPPTRFKMEALQLAIGQGYSEPVETTLARASAYLDWLNK